MFKPTFDTPFDQFAAHHGKRFDVLAGPIDSATGNTVSLEEMHTLLEECADPPYYRIRLETGEEIDAFPEEVLAEFEWSVNPND